MGGTFRKSKFSENCEIPCINEISKIYQSNAIDLQFGQDSQNNEWLVLLLGKIQKSTFPKSYFDKIFQKRFFQVQMVFEDMPLVMHNFFFKIPYFTCVRQREVTPTAQQIFFSSKCPEMNFRKSFESWGPYHILFTTLKVESFVGRNFRDFANFQGVRESLYPRNRTFIGVREIFHEKSLKMTSK